MYATEKITPSCFLNLIRHRNYYYYFIFIIIINPGSEDSSDTPSGPRMRSTVPCALTTACAATRGHDDCYKTGPKIILQYGPRQSSLPLARAALLFASRHSLHTLANLLYNIKWREALSLYISLPVQLILVLLALT